MNSAVCLNKTIISFSLVSLLCMIAIYLSGSRDVNSLPIENDTIRYMLLYKDVYQNSWHSLFQNFIISSNDYAIRDSGYPIFVKITQLICYDFTFFMYLTAAIFLIPFSMLIFKYVKSNVGIVLAYMIYFALYSIIVNSFMRQAIALGLILFAVRYINSNWKKFFLILIIAFLIHNSAVIAISLYFISKFISSKKWLLGALALSPLLMLNSRYLLKYITSGSVYENYGDNEMMIPFNYLILLFFAGLLAFFYYDIIKNVANYKILISGVFGTIMLLPIVWMGGAILRISYYYSLFIIPLFPVIIDNAFYNKDMRRLIYTVSILFFLYFALK